MPFCAGESYAFVTSVWYDTYDATYSALLCARFGEGWDMLKKYWRTGAHILLILLLVGLLLSVGRTKPQSDYVTSQPLTFVGEYSQNGGAWQPLTGDTQLSALEGDLVLRGHFDQTIPEGQSLNLYLDHLEYCLYINGKVVTWQLTADACSRVWDTISIPTVTPQDTVELHLRNHHRFGNITAYHALLDSFYIGPRTALRDTLAQQTDPLWAIGLLVTALSCGVLGVALAFSLSRIPNAYKLWSLGLTSVCMGLYVCLDAVDISLRLDLGGFLTMILATLEVNLFLYKYLTGPGKKIASITLYVQSIFVTGMVAICLLRGTLLYDLMLPWAMLQCVLCVVLVGCCIYEWHLRRNLRSLTLLTAFVLLVCCIVELLGTLSLTFPHGVPLKTAYLALFVLMVLRSVHYVVVNHQKTGQVEQLAAELENSRILMAMNQIRTHFIFNVLNAISGMCKYDPAKADRTVVLFARFLRTNIDIMQSDTPVTFHAALRHVEDYIALEQVRFGDRLNFVTDIEEDYFCLPPLTLQPLVENSIKHGLNSKPNGGTITVRTWVEGNDVCVSVHDDGVGYDTTQPVRDGSVGLQNVRFRLQHIMRATLTMESTVGEGTTATIRIPLEEATKCM